jgi:hypothetical protein
VKPKWNEILENGKVEVEEWYRAEKHVEVGKANVVDSGFSTSSLSVL